MFGVPAWAWRGGPVRRAVCVGVPIGVFLAALVIAEYAMGLSEARAQARQGRWVVWLAAAAVVVLAVLDTTSTAPRNAAVSWLFVVFFAVDIFWWPRVRDRLVVNAERTAQLSR